ncbi:MAG TPA: DNA polymerase III subunit beta, partial [Oceanithermus sp.]|nr:DNA polymerase III subunit beta [Oceanithermus sp.]
MRAGVAKRALAEAAGVLERIAPSKPSQPVLAQIRLEALEGGLGFRATNGEIDLELQVPAEVEGSGAALVPAALFGQLVRSLPSEYAELRLTPEGLELEGGRFATRIA